MDFKEIKRFRLVHDCNLAPNIELAIVGIIPENSEGSVCCRCIVLAWSSFQISGVSVISPKRPTAFRLFGEAWES